ADALSSTKPRGVLGKSGVGWGTKRFPGLPNVLRVVEIELDAPAPVAHVSTPANVAPSSTPANVASSTSTSTPAKEKENGSEVPSFKPARRDVVTSLSFEIDDQPLEDLAIGLDKLRERDGVIDVIQIPAFGKKGRMT